MSARGRGDQELSIEFPSLRALLVDVRAFSPRLARELRRDLRQTGDEIIAAQKAILDGPLPSGIAHTGYRLKMVAPRNGRGYVRKVRTYEDRDVNRSRSRGLREGIKAGLRTRVVAGKTRSEVSVKTTGPKEEGYNLAKVWERRRFRHPVFGDRETWVDQKGMPFFWAPAYAGRDRMIQRTADAVDGAVRKMST